MEKTRCFVLIEDPRKRNTAVTVLVDVASIGLLFCMYFHGNQSSSE